MGIILRGDWLFAVATLTSLASCGDVGPAGEVDTTIAAEQSLTSMSSCARTVAALPGIVAYWRFSETSGDIATDLVGGENANYRSVSLGAPGAIVGDSDPSATFLAAQKSSVDIPNDDLFNKAMFYREKTIALWFNPSSVSARQVLFEQGGLGGGLNIFIDGGRIYVGGWNLPSSESNWSGTFHSAPIQANTWQSVALTLRVNDISAPEPHAFKAYLNGALIGSGDGGALYASTANIRVGISGGTRFAELGNNAMIAAYSGRIDDLAYFNKALTAEEVGWLHTLGTGGVIPGHLRNPGEACSVDVECASRACVEGVCELRAGKPSAMYTQYTFGDITTTDAIETNVTWLDEPNKSAGIYPAFNFRFEAGIGGYMGLQKQGIKKGVLFSIWSELDRFTANCISSGLGTNLTFCGQKETAVENKFGQAGGSYAWQRDVEYRLRIERVATDAESQTWLGSILNRKTGESVEIGRIQLLNTRGYSGYGDLKSLTSVFLEYPQPHASPTCDQFHAHATIQWRGPFIEGRLADGGVNSSGSGAACLYRRQFSPTAGIVVHEGGGAMGWLDTRGQRYWGTP